jgi:hypothetical protein
MQSINWDFQPRRIRRKWRAGFVGAGQLQSDFLDAHQRHFDDAELLFEDQRWPNADHLYGLASECGLKRLMVAFGMVISAQGDPTKNEDRKHINELWLHYGSYQSGHLGYTLPHQNPFHNWHVAQRYAAKSQFDEQQVCSHRLGTRAVIELIHKARNDGLIW